MQGWRAKLKPCGEIVCLPLVVMNRIKWVPPKVLKTGVKVDKMNKRIEALEEHTGSPNPHKN